MKKATDNKYTVQLVTVTPEMARKLLDTSPRNRTINQKRVDKYAHDMIVGNWSPATMLIVDEDGHMVDAHHRLLAVIKAGKPIEMVKFTGLDKRFLPYIDTGRSRSAGDMLAFIEGLDGVKSLRNKSALVRVVCLIKMHDGSRIVGFDEIANCMLDNKDLVNASYEDFLLVRPLGATVGVAAAIYLIREANPACGNVDKFVNELAYGEMLQIGMPTYALRNALFNNNRTSGGQRQLNDVYFVLRAWKGYVSGEEMKQLRRPKVYDYKEDFQVAVAK